MKHKSIESRPMGHNPTVHPVFFPHPWLVFWAAPCLRDHCSLAYNFNLCSWMKDILIRPKSDIQCSRAAALQLPNDIFIRPVVWGTLGKSKSCAWVIMSHCIILPLALIAFWLVTSTLFFVLPFWLFMLFKLKTSKKL